MNPTSPLRRVGRRHCSVTAVMLLVAMSMMADLAKAVEVKSNDKPVKAAWQWTLDERISMRFDPAALQARAAAHAAEQAAHRDALGNTQGEDEKSAEVSQRTVDVIQGGKNPELFLPGELFDDLLLKAFPPEGFDASEPRRIIEERAVALGFGSDLWPRLRKVAAPVLEIEKKRAELARKDPFALPAKIRGEMDEDALVLCRARALALNEAEAEFGKELFLRLLYEAAVPTETMYILYDGIAEHERYLEGGCK